MEASLAPRLVMVGFDISMKSCIINPVNVLPHKDDHEPLLMRSRRKSGVAAPERSSKGFCVSRGCLDDLDSPTTPAQGPSWMTGFGVTESPGRCGTQPRKRILSAGGCELTCTDAPMPWLRKAKNAKQALCRVGFALPLNRSPESKYV